DGDHAAPARGRLPRGPAPRCPPALGEPAQHQPEERMAIRRLRECSRACDEAAIDKADERPQRNVLSERQREREAPLIDVGTSPHCVECDPEERAVCHVRREPERSPSATQKQDVRVVAAEQPLVQRFLQPPDDRCDGAACCGTNTRRPTLPAYPKATPFTAPRAVCRCSSANSSRSRRRIPARL